MHCGMSCCQAISEFRYPLRVIGKRVGIEQRASNTLTTRMRHCMHEEREQRIGTHRRSAQRCRRYASNARTRALQHTELIGGRGAVRQLVEHDTSLIDQA